MMSSYQNLVLDSNVQSLTVVSNWNLQVDLRSKARAPRLGHAKLANPDYLRIDDHGL
jgi:hypothetical protein